MAAVAPKVVAQAIATAIDIAAGTGRASITQSANGLLTVTPSSEQVPGLRDLIRKSSQGEPSVKVNVIPVIGPMIAVRAIPIIALVGGAIFFAGYYFRGRKAR